MNRPLHLYMPEMLTPYLFKSNRRKTSQEHPSAKERSSVLKTLKTAGTMYIPSTFSYKNALRIKHQDDERVYSSPPLNPAIRKES